MPQKSPFSPIPVCTEGLHEKLLRCIWNHSRATPERAALICAPEGTAITYSQLFNQSQSIHAFLKSRGFGRGDIAALVLHNCIEWPVFCLGAWAAGGAISGASALFTDYELERQFVDSECSVVFTDDVHLEKVLLASKKCKKIHTIICLGKRASVNSSKVVQWEDAIAHQPTASPTKVKPDSLSLLPYSSGTTGSPKGVMLSHRSFGTMIDMVLNHIERNLFTHDQNEKVPDWTKEHFLLNLPFYHIFGFGVLNIALSSGATGVIMKSFDPQAYCRAIDTFKIRMIFLVPPILIFLTKHPMIASFNLKSIEYVISGAAPAGRDICEEFLSKHPNVKMLSQGYGMTECGMASHLPNMSFKDVFVGVGSPGSMFEQKIIDVSTKKEVAIGERGEVCVRSPCLMTGYLNRPEATAETIDKEGWLHTGDIGFIDSEGRTYIVDRLKELIKVKGLQVPPAELEDLLLSHPLVRDAAIIGLPDKKRGELVRAYVVRANDSLKEADVISFVAQKVSAYKQITGGVVFVDEIPKSAAGKILRRELRDRAASEAKAAKAKL